jgi:autophagy-related protein 101
MLATAGGAGGASAGSMLSTGPAPWREHVLEELPCGAEDVGDAVTAVLHTILFTRAPGPVRPSEATCQAFPNVSYSLCAVGDVSRKVDLAVKVFEESVVQGAAVLGPPGVGSGYMTGSHFHYQQQQPYGGSDAGSSRAGGSGCLVVTFFERKVKKALFGLMSNEEKVVFEKWILPVNVASASASTYGASANESMWKEPRSLRMNSFV